MATKFTHRLYKDEFSKEFVYQLEQGQIDGLMATDESSLKVLVIEGELEVLEKLGQIMYCEDEKKIKSVFPSYITKEDVHNAERAAIQTVYETMLHEMSKLSKQAFNCKHKSGREWKVLYDAFCQMRELY